MKARILYLQPHASASLGVACISSPFLPRLPANEARPNLTLTAASGLSLSLADAQGTGGLFSCARRTGGLARTPVRNLPDKQRRILISLRVDGVSLLACHFRIGAHNG